MRTGHILDMTTRDGALVSAQCTCGHRHNQARTIGEARKLQSAHVEAAYAKPTTINQ